METIDKIENKAWNYEVWFPPPGSLVLCLTSGEPALFEIEGQDLLFLYSEGTTDAKILADIQTLQRAGYKGPFKAFRADLNEAGQPSNHLAAGAGEAYRMLLDCPIANYFVTTQIQIRGGL